MEILTMLYFFTILFLIAVIFTVLFTSILLASPNSTFTLDDSKTIKEYYKINSNDLSKFENIFNMLGVILLVKPVDFCTVLLIKIFHKDYKEEL